MADANIAHGTTLERSSDGTSSGSFSTVGDIYNITFPNLSRDAIDVTTLGSTERWREFTTGLKDPGSMSATIEFDPGDSDVQAWLTSINTDTVEYYKITAPDDGSTEWGFFGIVTDLSPGTPLDGRMEAEITIKLSGKPGFIPA